MKAVLIGANGQLGSDIFLTKPEDIELIPLTRKDVDITDSNRLKEIITEIKPDSIINTAAYHKTDECEENPEFSFKVNAIAVKDMANICREINAALLHISTDYVFSGGNKSAPYTEEDTPNPVNTYGISKYAGEIFIRNSLEKHYIIRVASLYGKAGASGKGGNFVYTMLKKGKEGAAVKVINDMFMSPTYTMDVSKEIWRIIKEQMPYGIYHITNSGYCSWYEFAKKILEIAGFHNEVIPVSHTEYKTKAKRPLWSPLESIKGIKIRRWEEALESFIASLNRK